MQRRDLLGGASAAILAGFGPRLAFGQQLPSDQPLPGQLVPPLKIPADAPRGRDRTIRFKGNIETNPVIFYLDGKQFDIN